ncbi:hypothetical protein BN1723_003269 [Verticillium longisporum]|uniref:Uncharacterized protein n=1 Tax=Verticillium longisporum TaxID=100787 RepID=A0A0G4LTG6_VERLO|nr:hypothetical protein BN1723_003269 [Verticillium longisporum]
MAVASLLIQSQAASCNADNCLRGLRNSAVVTQAVPFCSTYTAAASPATTGLPTYASGACACLRPSTTTVTPTTTLTTTPMPQTTTCPVSVSALTVTSVTTVTSIATDPTVAGPPGSSNMPNALFESGDGSADWCRNVEQSPCRIV